MSYPYQDNNTLVLPDEIWKDVPDYEGYYEVSNLGRVRSVDRVIPHPRLKQQKVKGRLLKAKVQQNGNTVSTPMIDLQVALSKDGKQHYYNIRRLVYSAFIAPIDFKADGLYVINKDCDGFNNRWDNLELVTKQQKSVRAFGRGRVPESYLKTADRSEWKNKNYGGRARRRPVKQIKLGSNEVREFKSITEASRKTGTGEKEIIGVAKGRYSSWNGYKWEYL